MIVAFGSIFFLMLLGSLVLGGYVPLPAAEAFVPEKQEKKAKAKTEADEQEILRQFHEEQAIQLLKSSLSLSRSVEDVPKRALLAARASELLWDYDQEFARSNISDAIDLIFDQYKELTAESTNNSIRRLNAAVDILVKILARKDPPAADAVNQRFARMRSELLKDTTPDPSAKERLSVARESLDVDIAQSVQLARKIIERVIPSTFPQYLYDLRRKDPSAADALYRHALGIMASRAVYTAQDSIYLSIYAFAERMVLIPITDVDNEGRLSFGIFTHQLSAPRYTPSTVLANEFLSSAFRHINTEWDLNSFKVNDPVQLVQWLFLTRKLQVYSSRLANSNFEGWQQLQTNLEVRCRNAGMDAETLPNLMGFAERLANSDDVFQFGDDSTFDKAKASQDHQQKTQLLVRGIWNVIQGGRFQEAENRLKGVEDLEVKEKLADLLNFYAGKKALVKGDWVEVTTRGGRIGDLRIRLLLLLESSRASHSSQKDVAYQLLIEAQKIIPKIASDMDKAKGFVALSSFSAQPYPQLSKESLIEAVKSINRSESYDGTDFQVEVAVLEDFRILLPLVHSGFDVCFRRAAQSDWTGAINLADELNSKTLKIAAHIAACRAFLEKAQHKA